MNATSDELRIACVGLGGWGKNVLRAAAGARHARLAAICDANADLLAERGRSFPAADRVQAYDELLGRGDIDAVLLATPAETHFDMAKRAIEAGKHVYVEKPMTLTADEASRLKTLVDASPQALMVGHLMEYHPAIRQIKRMIDDGDLGDIFYIYSKRLNLGVVRRNESALWSLAPHDVSIVLYLLGGEQPETISAAGQAFLQPGIEDVAFVYMQFATNQMAQVHASWLDPNKERKLVVVGSNKMVVFDDMHPNEKIRIYDKGANVLRNEGGEIDAISVRHGEIRVPMTDTGEPLGIEIQHFIDSVRNGETPHSDVNNGLRVVRVLEAATESVHQSGQPVAFAAPGMNA